MTDSSDMKITYRAIQERAKQDALTAKTSDSSFEVYAEALDDSGLQWYLKTGPMFGCVQFQATEG